jgi:hypothetical protein
MRISEGSLAFSASHTVQATLEGHDSVTAWAGSDRAQGSQDVRITMSGADAATHLQQLAGSHGYAAAASASAGHVRAMVRQSASHAAHAPAIAPRQLSAGLTVSAPSGISRTSSGSSVLSGTDSLWLMLVQIAGSKDAAADLADRLARFAATMQQGSGIAQALQAVADAHPTAQAAQATQPTQPPQPDWGYREDASVAVTETEQTSFAAAGTVSTADGRQITVATAFELARSTQMAGSASIRAGAALHDPLVLNTGVGAPTLGSATQTVDVNNDGTAEQVAALAPGSAYLVRDLNGNGLVDGGSELFGPATGNGFTELAALDRDHNGWIDEADAAWSQLGLWTGDAGGAIQTLGAGGVGAIATGSVATPFSYGEGGQLSAAGVYLHENGQAGVVGEINLYA